MRGEIFYMQNYWHSLRESVKLTLTFGERGFILAFHRTLHLIFTRIWDTLASFSWGGCLYKFLSIPCHYIISSVVLTPCFMSATYTHCNRILYLVSIRLPSRLPLWGANLFDVLLWQRLQILPRQLLWWTMYILVSAQINSTEVNGFGKAKYDFDL